jgi:hypothetical protein
MAWIKTIGLDDPNLTPELAATYQALWGAMPPEYRPQPAPADVAEIVKTHSLDPVALERFMGGAAHLIGGPSPLTRREREMINTTVSTVNRCFY